MSCVGLMSAFFSQKYKKSDFGLQIPAKAVDVAVYNGHSGIKHWYNGGQFFSMFVFQIT